MNCQTSFIEGLKSTLIFFPGHILACNIFYELEKVCTSIVAQDSEGMKTAMLSFDFNSI